MIDEYDRLQIDFLGLEPVLAYHCNRCNYYWLPKNTELYDWDHLGDKKPPKTCARCKSKYWRLGRKRKIKNFDPIGASISRIRSLLRSNKSENIGLAIYLIGHSEPKEADRLLGLLQKQMRPDKFEKFKKIVSERYASKPLHLESVLPVA